MADSNDLDVDNIIEQLLAVRGARPGRQVNLTENEIRWLCIKSREIFIQQPVLLELEAPIKICGMFCFDFDFSFALQVICFLYRGHPRPILWFVEAVWIWRLPSNRELFIFRWLCRSRKAVAWNHMSVTSLQNKVSWKFFHFAWQSRMCFNQQNLWILRWM